MISTNELSNFAFTIQIPSFKKVNFNDVYQPYMSLKETDQEEYIYKIVRASISDFSQQHFEIKFEKHQDGRVHAHGTLYQLKNEEIDDFVNSVCHFIGVKSPKQKRESCFCIPILFSYDRWNMYMNKEVEKTKDYSKYLFGKLN